MSVLLLEERSRTPSQLFEFAVLFCSVLLFEYSKQMAMPESYPLFEFATLFCSTLLLELDMTIPYTLFEFTMLSVNRLSLE